MVDNGTNNDERNNNSGDNSTSVLTIRLPKELKERITTVKNKMNSKISRVSQNYLNLSEIMIVREDNTKIGWDNDTLCIFPDSITQYLFNILNGNINNTNRFQIWANLGDELGKYLNNIFSLRGIEENDFEKMFEIIKIMGWFNFATMDFREDSVIVIPKDFGSKPMVYAMIYRILTKTRYPPDWNTELLDIDEKQEKEKRYKSIKDNLDPDLKKQSRLNFYYFRKLRIKSKEVE